MRRLSDCWGGDERCRAECSHLRLSFIIARMISNCDSLVVCGMVNGGDDDDGDAGEWMKRLLDRD